MENLEWGLKMTVLGMGLVFTLLGLLWALLTVILALDKGDEEEEAPASAAEAVAEEEPQQAAAGNLTADVLSAIVVATLKHRKALRGGAASLMKTTWSGAQSSLWVAAGRARQTNNWISRGR